MNKTAKFFFLLAAVGLLETVLQGAGPEFRSKHLAIGLAHSTPAFSVFAVDSLGQGKLEQNPVLAETNAVSGLELDGASYRLNGRPVWRVAWSEKHLTLRSDYLDAAELDVLNRIVTAYLWNSRNCRRSDAGR